MNAAKSVKIVTVVGARPQFIKAAAVSRLLRSVDGVVERLVHTGQHYDDSMSAVFFRELEIPRPDHELGVGSAPHGAQTGQMLARIEEILTREMPDWVLVYGDTNSTLAGALAAAKLHIPVAHVEAGLRSFNRAMPEEINRVVSDHLSVVLFAPTAAAVENLRLEGIDGPRVCLVGDVMYDAALFYSARVEGSSRMLEALGLDRRAYVLATIHRAENTDAYERLSDIFSALGALSLDLPVVVPLHPRTRKALLASGVQTPASLRIIDPVGYLDMTMLEKHARLIVTDSGGVQKEAYFHGVPCATLRTETEWVELIQCGWNRLLPPTGSELLEGLRDSLLCPVPKERPNLYGVGEAAREIVAVLAPGVR